MSWQDRIDNIQFTIVTGDGKEYKPLWKTQGKSKEYNASIYDFIGVSGSFVDRKRPKSAKHTLTFVFQGENHVDISAEFETSADDPRSWSVTHPYYGVLVGQPLSITFNEDALNVTLITVEFWESSISDLPLERVSVRDRTEAKTVSVLSSSSAVYASDIEPSSSAITKIKDSNTLTESAIKPILTDESAAEFSNAVSKSLSSADNLLNAPSDAISDAQKLFSLPSTFAIPVIDRVNALRAGFDQLKLVIETVSDKLFFEAQAAACISGICSAVVNPLEEDYVIRTEVEEMVSILSEVYNEYVTILDDNQVQIYDVQNTFIPNIETQQQLFSLVAFTSSNLFNLAFDAKQLRIVYTTKTTNVILLSHRYLGVDKIDGKLDNFIELNNIKLDELFSIKKGREIKYFV